jgi:DNA (cytosine-5)-methyltransferase 1
MRRTTSRTINAVDLFCGVGGLTHGLERGGINVVAGVDNDPACAFAYEKNNSARFLERDVAQITAEEIAALYPSDGLRLLAGCAPCQPFSTYSRSGRGKKHENDWPLLLSFGRLVEALQPDFVTMENVPQVLDHAVFRGFLDSLKGYTIRCSVVDCAAFGIPQTRKRVVLLASRHGSEGLELHPSLDELPTVRGTIGALPPIAAGEHHADDALHAASRLSPLNLERIRASRPGGTWRDWPAELQAACHKRSSGSTYPSVYGRMAWDHPAPTVTTQCFGYGNGRFGHPEQDRAITLREAAMLQTFPENYEFLSPGAKVRFSHLGRLIGNAVPVRLGEVIAAALHLHRGALDASSTGDAPNDLADVTVSR